jgi:hypothetical protein
MPGITIQIMGDGAGAAEALRIIEERMQQTETKGAQMSEVLAEAGERVRGAFEMVGIGIGLTEIADRMKEMTAATMEAAVQLGHLSQQTGISVENLSSLKFAAQETGVDFDVLTRGFKKLAVSVYEADGGNAKAAKGFQQLGISTADLKAKGNDMYAVMDLIAQKFSQMPEGIAKSDTAAKIFGARMGAEMIPALNALGGQMDELQAKARALGVVWDEDGIKQMEEMHKQITDLKTSYQGLAMTLTAAVAPALERVAELMQRAMGISPESLQSARAMSAGKSIPDVIAGSGDPAAIAQSAAMHKAALEKQLSDAKLSHEQKAALQKQWHEADLRENQAYFVQLQDQITAAHIDLDNANKELKSEGIQGRQSTQDWVDHAQGHLKSLLTEQTRAMDSIDAAQRGGGEGNTGGLGEDGIVYGKSRAQANAELRWEQTRHLTEALYEQAEAARKDKVALDAIQGEAAWEKIGKDAQATVDKAFQAKPISVRLQTTDDDPLGPAKRDNPLGQSAIHESAKTVGDFLDRFSQQALQGKINFKSLVDSAIMDMERWAMKVMEEKALIPLLNSLFGMGGGASNIQFGAGGNVSTVNGVSTAMFMAGGGELGGNGDWAVVGDGPHGEMDNAEIFAPKGPGSVLPHDVLAGIAKGGGGGNGGAPTVQINNINNSSQPVQMKQAGVSFDSEARAFIIHTVLEDAASGGPVAGMLGGFQRG